MPADDIDEPVELVAYDSGWPARFSQERERIAGSLALPAGSIEHIGSTAVPDLAAKPVVDMMLGTANYPPPPGLLSALMRLGYSNLGEAGVPGRTYLRLRGHASFNLHVVRREGDHWNNNLGLREYLRRHPDARTRYEAAKREALRLAGPRLLAYSGAKHGAIVELLEHVKEA